MQLWKRAFWLAKFEVKASLKGLLLLLVMTIVVLNMFITSFSDYLQHGLFLYDIMFLIVFGGATAWVKPKELQVQKLGEELWVSPYFIMLHQLAIPKDILIKSRFVNYYLFAIPSHILIFLLLYIFSAPLRDFLSIGAYLSFSLIWICFGIYFGSVYPASDSGEYVSNIKMSVYVFLLIFGTSIGILLIRFYSGNGIVYWTMIAASNWPLLSAGLSLVFALAGAKYWLRYTAKNMQKIDYLK